MEHKILDSISSEIFDDIMRDFSNANNRSIGFIYNEICKIRESKVLILPESTFGIMLDKYNDIYSLVEKKIVAVRINENALSRLQIIYENERYTSDNKKETLCDEKYFAHYIPNGSNSPFIVRNFDDMCTTEFIVTINTILLAMQELKGDEIHELKMVI